MLGEEDVKVALFLGAGASAFAGYRTFQTFPDLIFSSLPEAHQRRRSSAWAIYDLLENIQKYLHMTGRTFTHDNYMRVLVNYTDLLQQLRQDSELKSRFISTTDLENQFRNFDEVVEKAIEFITERTISHYSENRVKSNPTSTLDSNRACEVVKLFHQLAEKNSQSAPFLPLFTTNYDMLIEDLFEEYTGTDKTLPNFKLITGFDLLNNKENPWSSELYKQRGGVHYYRLHGCVTWFRNKEKEEETESKNTKDKPFKVIFRRGELTREEMDAICAMLPGYKNGSINSLYNFAFRQLYETLLTTQVIIFAGYSFQDRDVNHLLLSVNEQRQRSNPLKIIVVNPNKTSDQIIRTFNEVIGQSHLPMSCPSEDQIICLSHRFGDDMELFNELIAYLP